MREIKFRCWDGAKMHYMENDEYVGDFFSHHEIYQNIHGGEREFLQYTGLKDKNGQEIYEGDILKTSAALVKVEYFTPYAAFVGVNEDDFLLDLNEDNTFEVIGNVFENPELLKP